MHASKYEMEFMAKEKKIAENLHLLLKDRKMQMHLWGCKQKIQDR